VVTRRELLAAGVSRREIEHRLATGALLQEHRGVYRVGHRAPSVEARYLAAVLACGEGALLSGRAAGHLWGLLKGAAPPPEVTAPTERHIAGIRTRRSRKIDPADATTHRGIPITTVPFTLIALAAQLDAEELARACHGDVRVTLSKLEQRFLELLRDHGLPLPQTNRQAGARRVDCRWPTHRLTIELDGYRYHHSRHAWEQDRRREREARARGDDFRRYTYGDVLEQPALMLAELRALLLASTEGALPDAPSVVAVPRTKL
jgi:very-short-patch-repair endonuclease